MKVTMTTKRWRLKRCSPLLCIQRSRLISAKPREVRATTNGQIEGERTRGTRRACVGTQWGNYRGDPDCLPTPPAPTSRLLLLPPSLFRCWPWLLPSIATASAWWALEHSQLLNGKVSAFLPFQAQVGGSLQQLLDSGSLNIPIGSLNPALPAPSSKCLCWIIWENLWFVLGSQMMEDLKEPRTVLGMW